jgi:acetylornithine deacetylase/succinyl-diaminopimelate desuccinylase-like protein
MRENIGNQNFAAWKIVLPAALALVVLAVNGAGAEGLTAQQQLAHDIYQELIEIDTTTATGDTARAVEAMAARLKAAGFAEAEVQAFSPAPRKGNLVARLHGSGARKPILLVAHLDVVPASGDDWSVDPFKLTEKDGYFYARGSGDDKYMAASFIANLIRYKNEGYKPDRDIIVALETDEEIFDRDGLGIQWLIRNHRDLIDAEFALNEGGGVGLKDGKPIRNSVQTSEKVALTYQIDVKNRGGHSAVPAKDNAIYHLAEGLVRLSKFSFPAHLNDTTRAFFERSAQLEGGNAINALPQLASAKVNCRIMPGESVDEVKATLERVLADDQIKVTQLDTPTLSAPSVLNEEIAGAIEKLSREFFPGAIVLPVMSAGATDGSFLRNAGIPTYGHSGMAIDVGESRIHGKDERVPVKSFYQGGEYLYRLVKVLSGGGTK